MFLRRYTRTKDGKTHTYYALVESVRTESGPRQHVVAYLGELNHDQERRWQRTVVFHNRQGEDRQLRLFPDADPISLPDDPDIVRVRQPSNSSNSDATGTRLRRRLSRIFQRESAVSGFLTMSPAASLTLGSNQCAICQSPRIQRWRRRTSAL